MQGVKTQPHRVIGFTDAAHTPLHVLFRMPAARGFGDGDVCCPVGIVAVVSPGVCLLVHLQSVQKVAESRLPLQLGRRSSTPSVTKSCTMTLWTAIVTVQILATVYIVLLVLLGTAWEGGAHRLWDLRAEIRTLSLRACGQEDIIIGHALRLEIQRLARPHLDNISRNVICARGELMSSFQTPLHKCKLCNKAGDFSFGKEV